MSPTATPILRADGLRVGWGETVLLESATFEIARGEIFAVLGGSGCGKSTLLRFLVGLEQPLAGELHVDVPPGPPPGVGVMFQGGALLGSMTVLENVALPLETWTDLPADAIDAVARARLRLVGLSDAAGKLPAEISGGMKKRAAIARALALEPTLLFLDEPSAGLDPVAAVELDELILTLRKTLGLTVVMVTHELESIFKVVDRCIMLDRETKGILVDGDPRELRDRCDDPRVRSFFHRTAAEAA